MNFTFVDPSSVENAPLACAVPQGFRRLAGRLQQFDRQLGYFGQDRFVLFYFEPRGGEVLWIDSRSSGFGTGAWRVFFDEVEPLARRQGADFGTDEAQGPHALVLDRVFGQAYYADHRDARAFLASQTRHAMSA